MPRTKLPHLQREQSRHGTWKWYVRIGKGPRIRIKAIYGSKEFMAEYHAAICGAAPKPKIAGEPDTLAWAIHSYMATPQWARHAAETRKQLGYQFKRMEENAGDELLAEFDKQAIIDVRERRAAKPSDANKFIRAMRKLFDYAIDQKWVAHNPARDVEFLKTSKDGEGFYTWTDDDMTAFEKRWPIGTRERLAYEIIATTGLRRGDTFQFGAQHIRNGEYTVRTSKTGQSVTAPLHPDLIQAIRMTNRIGETVFLLNDWGRPFKSKEAFGNWFGRACRAAGVEGNAHGIRKKLASDVAELGATEAQLNAFFGWEHGSRQSATYVQKASRKKMARDVAETLANVVNMPNKKRSNK
ncbi:MAG: tyrosine-type recombinase/integrase [Armatimonadia bacterium]